MNCNNCRGEVDVNATYCPHCGTKIQNNDVNYGELTSSVPKASGSKKVWDIFALVGFGIGIGSLGGFALGLLLGFGNPFSGFSINILGCTAGVYGIVFSALGKKSIVNRSKARLGLVMSIIGTIIGFIIAVVWVVVDPYAFSDYISYYVRFII